MVLKLFEIQRYIVVSIPGLQAGLGVAESSLTSGRVSVT